MNTHQRVASALATALALGLVGTAGAQDSAKDSAKDRGKKEKCFGIAKAGSNDCANLSGSHSCAGQAKAEYGLDEWRYVPMGTCKDMKGMTLDEVKAKLNK